MFHPVDCPNDRSVHRLVDPRISRYSYVKSTRKRILVSTVGNRWSNFLFEQTLSHNTYARRIKNITLTFVTLHINTWLIKFKEFSTSLRKVYLEFLISVTSNACASWGWSSSKWDACTLIVFNITNVKIFDNLTSINHPEYLMLHHPFSITRKTEPFLIKPLNKPNYLLTSFFTDQ